MVLESLPPGRGSIRRATLTPIPSRKSCWTSGTGRSTFAGQPEILRYLQHVADKFDLRRDIQFSSEVKSALYDDASRSWEVELRDGSRYRSRFLITGIGNLSYPVWPRIEGIESFRRGGISHGALAAYARGARRARGWR